MSFSYLVLGVIGATILTIAHSTSLAALTNPCWKTRDFDIVPYSTCFSYAFCYYGYPVGRGWCFWGTAFDAELKQCTKTSYDKCLGIRGTASATSPISFECPINVVEAFYPDFSSGCPTSKFFKCNFGSVQELNCDHGLSFNEGTDKCENATRVPCGAILKCPPSLLYGVYADYADGCPPKEFVQCFGGFSGEAFKIRRKCPLGLFYNEGIKSCDVEQNVPCKANNKYKYAKN